MASFYENTICGIVKTRSMLCGRSFRTPRAHRFISGDIKVFTASNTADGQIIYRKDKWVHLYHISHNDHYMRGDVVGATICQIFANENCGRKPILKGATSGHVTVLIRKYVVCELCSFCLD